MEAGLITQHQIDHALTLQKNRNKRLGKILVELGYVTELQIAEALAQQLSLPLVDCDQFEITPELTLHPVSETETPQQYIDSCLIDWHTLTQVSIT